jgi:hypothetical protein
VCSTTSSSSYISLLYNPPNIKPLTRLIIKAAFLEIAKGVINKNKTNKVSK